MKSIKQNTFVVFNRESCTKKDYKKYFKKIFDKKVFVYLGEIEQAPGHCILADLDTGKIIGLYHVDNFRKATDTDY